MDVNGCARGTKADIAFENEEDACVSRDVPPNSCSIAVSEQVAFERGVVCEAEVWTRMKMRHKGESLLLCSRKTKWHTKAGVPRGFLLLCSSLI